MPEKRLDPRDLISPPWRTCPACGKDKFGVSIISGSRLMRRCRDCWHQRDYRLPELRKKIIYLDQFVISNLMKLENPVTQRHATVAADPFWRDLHDLLFQLRHLQMICCPDSGSHEEESRTWRFNAELKKTYEALSGGITFQAFDSIKSQQIGELACAWSERREAEYNFDPRRVLSNNLNEWNERFYITCGDNPFIVPAQLKLYRAELHAHIARLFRDVWAKEKRSFRYWYDLERFGYQGHLGNAVVRNRKERLEAMLAYRPGAEISVKDLEKTLPSFAETLLASMRHIMRFPRDGGERSRDEISRLETEFGKANRIAEAPFVRLQSLMFAAMAMRAAHGQKEPPDEGTTTDVETVAHLLPYCDAMFMDSRCRSLLLDVPKDLRPPETARVFSLNIKAQYLDYLRSIRDGITPEHVAAIREVYGDNHLEGVPSAQDKR
ncbi:MAG: hypothetical protein DMG27_15595 [Acidobacteria bacterium]|nr:MAG: hypothetical protein DMG27_15595 [Acidobacteriota bacterium]